MGSQSEYTKEEMDFINKKLEAIARVAARTEKEIRSIFTKREISYVRAIWRGSENPNGMPFRDLLLYKIVHSIHEEVLRIKWNVNKKTISQKINDLTDYQAFTLIRVAVQQRNFIR
ncbi:hypothetical protein [Virgibacillus salexigens]|uniref:Uncharacterized protein n=1 Tax=Virgibacillus kapii TaxID=1638645 RepID=A0ABQ2DEV3_9BACI|nr:hypothetical protein [Virgibacillus kapii]GGJ55343.1 hypothetical protein GCM10007111_17040 [Virgibacillus kapii]